jgi:wyosine [tRNA(Phe)-imidazoG37] synthetase (radical SAM superfamily)
MSLGIDLTPQGHCSFSCVYCQASHPPTRNPDLNVSIARMRDDLILRLRDDRGELKDIVLAGSGEPTSVPNLGDALEAIQDVVSTLQLTIPLRIFTNGRHLDRPEVRAAVGQWCDRGGQVWVKLDAATEDSVALINGRRFDVDAHLRALWSFARDHSVGLQTMLLRGPGLPDPEHMAEEVLKAVKAGMASGAKISELHLLTLSRPPADDQAAAVLQSVPAEELASLAERIRAETILSVSVFPGEVR